jgi:hypothetical protein
MRGRKRIGEVVTARFEAVLHARLTLMTYQHEATPVMYVDLEDVGGLSRSSGRPAASRSQAQGWFAPGFHRQCPRHLPNDRICRRERGRWRACHRLGATMNIRVTDEYHRLRRQSLN